MAAVTVGLNEGGIPAQLQLLLLQCLASAMNVTQSVSSLSTNLSDSKQSVTVTVDDFLNNESNEKLITSLEINITKLIQEFKTTMVGEITRTSSTSQQLLNDILQNFIDSSVKYQGMLNDWHQDNAKQFSRNTELEEKLLNLTQEGIHAQQACVKENSKMHNTNQDLQTMLTNMTNTNDKLEETISAMSNNIANLNEKILKLTESNQQLLGSVGVRDTKIEQLEVKVKEMANNNQQLNMDLNKVTAKYTKLQKDLGVTELQQQNYCRISSSSVMWKLAHKDTQTQSPAGAFVWTPTLSELAEGKMQILYSSSRDKYVRSVGKEEMDGWDKGIYEHNSMFRMVENDFRVAYLARKVGTPQGMISWKFDLSGSGTSVDSIAIRFSTSVFKNGQVDAKACTSSECINIPIGNQVFETRHFEGVSQFSISATTRLGLGGSGWQHAQLFRQLLSDLTGYGFEVIVNLKRCDVLVL